VYFYQTSVFTALLLLKDKKGMKIRACFVALSVATLLSGCQNFDSAALMQSGAQAFQAATLSDEQVKALSEQSCQKMDSEAQIAQAGSKYQQRLDKIAAALGNNINGTPANYKVYVTKDVNAWAMANGCIRVYSGLMDMMSDNEVEAVLGHEMGHVALGHSRKAMQLAYATTAARTAAASVGGIAATLSQSQLGDLGEKLINAQFSQTQESQADDYSYDLLKKRNIDPNGLVTSFEKLAKLEGSQQSSMFDSHPSSESRAEHIKARIAADK
jgi:putative metalloprotease